MSGIVVAAIAPHGGIAVAELCDESELETAAATRAGLEELGRRVADAKPEAVVVAPGRDLPPDVHVAAGRVIAETAASSGKRVALIASADHGHAHDPTGPYGFDPASAAYDRQIVELVCENRLAGLLEIDPGFV